MNKITSCMTVVAALAVGSAFAELTPFDSLGLSDPVDTFSNTADQAKAYEGELSGDAVLTVSQKTFAAQPVEKFTISFQPTFADFADLPSPDGAKVGFAFTDSNKAAYYNGTSWTAIDLSSAVAEDVTQTVIIELDRRVTTKGKVKARFTLGSTAVTEEWVDVDDVTANAVAIYGTGTIVSINGKTFTIETSSEVIVIHPEAGKNVTFSETQIDTMASQLGGATPATPAEVAAALKVTTAQANGLTALDNFVLFGKVTGATAADKPVVQGAATAAAPGSNTLTINVGGLANKQKVSGATVSFQLQGKTSTGWENVGESNERGVFELTTLPTVYRTFKVVTTVSYDN